MSTLTVTFQFIHGNNLTILGSPFEMAEILFNKISPHLMIVLTPPEEQDMKNYLSELALHLDEYVIENTDGYTLNDLLEDLQPDIQNAQEDKEEAKLEARKKELLQQLEDEFDTRLDAIFDIVRNNEAMANYTLESDFDALRIAVNDIANVLVGLLDLTHRNKLFFKGLRDHIENNATMGVLLEYITQNLPDYTTSQQTINTNAVKKSQEKEDLKGYKNSIAAQINALTSLESAQTYNVHADSHWTSGK